jgi:hypothetical protein
MQRLTRAALESTQADDGTGVYMAMRDVHLSATSSMR